MRIVKPVNFDQGRTVSMNMCRVVLTDDHTLVRSGLKSLLEHIDGVEVVAEAASGREAIEMVSLHQPDVILMDISMQDMNGLDAGVQIARDHPDVRIIVLSMHDSEEYVTRALRFGAVGYVLKDAATVELKLALQAVMAGQTYLSPKVSRTLVDSYMQQSVGKDSDGGHDVLTPRQTEILKSIVEGLPTKQIAFNLGVSIKTIETHRAQMMERLGIHDVAGLVRYAIRTGLISA